MNVDTTKLSYLGIFSRGIAGIVFGCAITGSITIFPGHNIIDNEDYWYETLLIIILCYVPISTAGNILDFSYRMNTDCIRTMRKWIVLCRNVVLVSAIIIIVHYCTWRYGFNYIWKTYKRTI